MILGLIRVSRSLGLRLTFPSLNGQSGPPPIGFSLPAVLSIYCTQSAIKIFVSCSTVPLRFEAHTSRLPSDENMGKASNPG
jgi:hypothetical protein